MYSYQHITPTDWFGFPWKKYKKIKNHCDTSKKYFVAVGDSFTWGEALPYNNVWPSVVSKISNIGHVNIAWNGASIEASNRFLEKSLSINPNAIHVYMLTYPWRSQSVWAFKGDRNRRISDSKISSIDCAKKIKDTLEKYKNYNILFTNVWGYTNDILDEISAFSNNYNNFLLNTNNWIDRASDNSHAGPEMHYILAQQIYEKLKELNYA